MSTPDPHYDVNAALALAPGVVLTREVEAGLHAAYVAGGFQKLTQAQVLAVTGPAPAPLTSLRRLDCEDFEDFAPPVHQRPAPTGPLLLGIAGSDELPKVIE